MESEREKNEADRMHGCQKHTQTARMSNCEPADEIALLHSHTYSKQALAPSAGLGSHLQPERHVQTALRDALLDPRQLYDAATGDRCLLEAAQLGSEEGLAGHDVRHTRSEGSGHLTVVRGHEAPH